MLLIILFTKDRILKGQFHKQLPCVMHGNWFKKKKEIKNAFYK